MTRKCKPNRRRHRSYAAVTYIAIAGGRVIFKTSSCRRAYFVNDATSPGTVKTATWMHDWEVRSTTHPSTIDRQLTIIEYIQEDAY